VAIMAPVKNTHTGSFMQAVQSRIKSSLYIAKLLLMVGVLAAGTSNALSAPATMISTGDFHSCALLSGGAVKCWGSKRRWF